MTDKRLRKAAHALLSRKDEGPSEDAHIFAEWDDLRDALEEESVPDVMKLQPFLRQLEENKISSGKMRHIILMWLDNEINRNDQ